MTLSEAMRRDLGMTIAVWFAPDSHPQQVLSFLRRTLDDVELFVDPGHLFIVVDGCPQAVTPTEQAAAEVVRAGAAPRVLAKSDNEGQGGAVAHGLERLLAETDVRYLCTRDADGDHDIYDVPHLYRRLIEVEAREETDRVFVVGSRGDLHRPIGYARGELEQVLNEVTVKALTALGTPPRLDHCRIYGEYPDFQSGFKLYTRWSAEIATAALRGAHEREPELAPLRWGVQFISTVELLNAGAIPAAVYRLTYDQQPQSTFEGHGDLPRAYGCQLAWLFGRLDLAPELAWPILDAGLTASLLSTVPGGREALLELRRYVAHHAWNQEPPPAPLRGAMF